MPDPQNPEKALGRWEDEGGAEPDGAQLLAPERLSSGASSPPTAAEWAEMHTRVIALETLVVALLATAGDAQRSLAREMAEMITPRAGARPHPLTVHAAHRMGDLIERAKRHDATKE
jgi:hypothetical protein